MKKNIIIKLLIILFISILIILLKSVTCLAVDYGSPAAFANAVRANPDLGYKGTTMYMSQYALNSNKNTYCIEHTNTMYSSTQSLVYAFRLEGQKCTNLFDTSQSYEFYSNVALAGMLSNGSQTYGYYPVYSNTQSYLYMYLDTWVQCHNERMGGSGYIANFKGQGGGGNWTHIFKHKQRYLQILAEAEQGVYDNKVIDMYLFRSTRAVQTILVAVDRGDAPRETALEITKVSEGDNKPLQGVEFLIQRGDGAYIKDAKEVKPGVYKPVGYAEVGYEGFDEFIGEGQDSFKQTEAYKFKTDANGKLKIVGLEDSVEYTAIEYATNIQEFDTSQNIGRQEKFTAKRGETHQMVFKNIPGKPTGLKITKTYNKGNILTEVGFVLGRLDRQGGTVQEWVSEAIDVSYENSGSYRCRNYAPNLGVEREWQSRARTFFVNRDGWIQVTNLKPGWYRVIEAYNSNPGFESQWGKMLDFEVRKEQVIEYQFDNTTTTTQFRIQKLDKATKKKLQGAQFSFELQHEVRRHYADRFDWCYDRPNRCDDPEHWRTEWENVAWLSGYTGSTVNTSQSKVVLTTDADGYIMFVGANIMNLIAPPQGEKRRIVVTEENAPKGYDKITKPIIITKDDIKEGLINTKVIENHKTGTPTNPSTSTHRGNATISGMVWKDELDGKGNKGNSQKDSSENGVPGVVVRWMSGGEQLDSTITDENGKYTMTYTVSYENHTYSLPSSEINKLNNSYIEFQYNGMKYTTVAITEPGDNKSIARENATERNKLNNSFKEITNQGVSGTTITSSRLNYIQSQSNASESKPAGADVVSETLNEFKIKASTNGVASGLLSNYKFHRRNSSSVCVSESTDEDGHTHHSYGNRETSWEIWNMNLGLVEREQPDVAITSDLYKVVVEMKNQRYTYYYNARGIQTPGDYDYTAKFSGKYDQKYRRPVNPSDIEYMVDNKNSDEMKVYVEYHIRAKNQSATLSMKVGEIVNYFDSGYTYDTSFQKSKLLDSNLKELKNNVSWTSGDGKGSNKHDKQMSSIHTGELKDTVLKAGEQSNILSITFKVTGDRIREVTEEDKALLHNVSEISAYTTLHGDKTLVEEYKTASSAGKAGQLYAGLDKDSQPGSVQITINDGEISKTSFEDDTDMAPTFILVKDNDEGEVKYKTISGTVFEDKSITPGGPGQERRGDGVYNEGDNPVQNVKVELLKVKDDGTGLENATLYDEKLYTDTKGKDTAIRYTDENGNFTFEGVVVDTYVIRYTYGDKTEDRIVDESDKIDGNILNEATTIDGTTTINARNYKSTVITGEPVKTVMGQDSYGDDDSESYRWHLTTPDGTSIAVDNLKKRSAIGSLKNSTYDDKINMTAYSKQFKVQVEYTTDKQSATMKQEENGDIEGKEYIANGEDISLIREKDENDKEKDTRDLNILQGKSEDENRKPKDYDHEWTMFDFGIIERAREDIVLNKTIKHIRITLANGQILTEGEPYATKLNYVKALGEGYIYTREDYEKSKKRDKLLYMEIDSELIQGARLDILYEMTVTNNSEKDYEYIYDYTYNNVEPITHDSRASYYYYGETLTIPEISNTVELVADYMDPELTCTVGSEISRDDVEKVNSENWEQVKFKGGANGKPAEQLGQQGLVSDPTIEIVNKNNYLVFKTKSFDGVITDRADASKYQKKVQLFASKLLGNQAEEYTYENHAEILQLNGRIARTIDSVEADGKQVEKTYKPGDYTPNVTIIDHKQDDDAITIRITPPTGTTDNAIMYISAGVIGLIVLAGGIYFIKKKIIG